MNLVVLISMWCFLDFIKVRCILATTSFSTAGTTTPISVTTEQPIITTISTAETTVSSAGTLEVTSTDSSNLQPPVSTSTSLSYTLFPTATTTTSPPNETTSGTPMTPNNEVTNTTSTTAPDSSIMVDADIGTESTTTATSTLVDTYSTTDVPIIYIPYTTTSSATEPSTTTSSPTEINDSSSGPTTATHEASNQYTVPMTVSNVITASTLLPLTCSSLSPTTETTEEIPITTNTGNVLYKRSMTDISITVQPRLLFNDEFGSDGQIFKKPKLELSCHMNGNLPDDVHFTVFWYVNDICLVSKGPVLLSNINDTNLVEDELIERGHKLNINIRCVVIINGGYFKNKAVSSLQFWLGIRVLNPTVKIIQGKKATIQLQPTFPFGCSSKVTDINKQDRCLILIYVFDPYDTNTCESNSISVQESQPCGIEIPGFYYHEWTEGEIYDNVIDVVITTKGKIDYYPGRQVFVLKLLIIGTGMNDIMHGNYLSDITVISTLVTAWQAKICYAYVDPHMRSFDGRYYENQNLGVFVMYRHKSNKQEVQMKTKQCNSFATCACSVAVRAGGDIFLIDLCRSPEIINQVSCKENILHVRQISSYWYQIYMPLGTMVSVIIHNWWGYESTLSLDIHPSVRDVDETQGLCGVLNDNEGDDFMTPSGSIEIDNNVFSISWRIDDAESYFNPVNHDPDLSQMWQQGSVFCFCADTFDATTPPFCSASLYSACTQQAYLYGTPYPTCNSKTRRSRQSLSREIERILSRTVVESDNKTHNVEKRSTLTITFEDAMNECKHFFNFSCTTSSLENSLPDSNHDFKNSSISNCALDYMYTGNMSLASLHCEAYRSQVDAEVRRNSTFREANPDIVESFRSIACINNCNNHGECKNGNCICDDKYIEDDCSVSLRDYPAVVDTYAGGLCQLNRNVCCGGVPIYGSRFVKGITKQKLERFKIYINGTNLVEKTTVEELPILNPFEAEITVPCGKRKRASPNSDNSSIPFITGTRVSLTNDGFNYGPAQVYYIYDSTCQGVLNSTDGYTFYLLHGTCFIGEKCYTVGELDASDFCRRCVPSVNAYSWTNACVYDSTDPPRSKASPTITVSTFVVILQIVYVINGMVI
ncbi:hypothetical protein CHS0354_011415 [Potamilus streckersoni]|uniref:VWFD domain-containing protein n=1 Tax=Potamilus streckersoni TaxID=2493646 RepID=A0AAE0TGU7_9BIVA|nr:hypothetical protein CHS0354_011415 [Potamilus streckersoni]